MTRASKPRVLIAVLGVGCSLWLAAKAGVFTGGTSAPSQLAPYGRLQLSFEPNVGQASKAARFVAHASGASFQFEPSGVVLALRPSQEAPADGGPPLAPAALGLRFVGSNPDINVAAGSALGGRVNYLVGDDPSGWRTDVPTYGTITYQRPWSGIDVVYEGNDGRLKGTYTVAPGADPAVIRWTYENAKAVELDPAGKLRIAFGDGAGNATEEAPVAWQDVAGQRRQVDVRYTLGAHGEVGFAMGAYDRGQPLVIDPILTYSTFLGGVGSDAGQAIAVDGAGNAFVAGTTTAAFPTTDGAHQMLPPQKDPTLSPTSPAVANAFVAKLSADGAALLYATYLGGNGKDRANGIWVDPSCTAGCEVFVAGQTTSTNFPTAAPGGSPFQSDRGGEDGFVTKLNGTGSALVYSTYLGGESIDRPRSVAVDSAGRAVVVGETTSASFPMAGNPPQASYKGQADAFVSMLDPQGTGLAYSTYLGGSRADNAWGVAVGPGGHAFVAGETSSTDFRTTQGSFQPMAVNPQNFAQPFVGRLTEDGVLEYSTYLGSTQAPTGTTVARDIAVDATGSAYVVGTTFSSSFPTTPGALQPVKAGTSWDAFVSKLNAAGSALAYSTYLGGSPVCHPSNGTCAGGTDEGFGIAVDEFGRAYVTGSTTSRDFPTVRAVQEDLATGVIVDLGDFTVGGSANVPDAFVAALDEYGAGLLYSTYLGGSPVLCGPQVQCLDGFDQGLAIAVDDSGVYATGITTSRDFPTAAPIQSHADQGAGADAFVTKIVDPDGPPPTTTTTPSTTTTTLPAEANDAVADFDGNGSTDVSVFRPSEGTWFVKDGDWSAYGTEGDIPVPGDYDGDGATDTAIFRPSTGLWAIHNSATGTDTFVTYGIGTDTPVPADYDGDGKTDIAVFRAEYSTWWHRQSSTGTDVPVTFGIGTDVPVPGDYDGDGKGDVAVFRDGTWYHQPVAGGDYTAFSHGNPGDIPTPGDYDGDGDTDPAVFRPSSGTWHAGGASVAIGAVGDIPVAGDYDGDGTTDLAVYHRPDGTWHLEGGATVAWGNSTDIPLPIPYSVRKAFFS